MIPWKNKRGDSGGEASPLGGVRDEMDRLFDTYLREPLGRAGWLDKCHPAMDIEENAEEVVVRAEVPGMKAEELDLSVCGNRLVLSGEKKECSEKQGEGYFQQERRFGSFRREIALPSTVDTNDVRAECKDGILTVRLKKTPASQTKKINVQAS
jgi:HSP20 family protein